MKKIKYLIIFLISNLFKFSTAFAAGIVIRPEYGIDDTVKALYGVDPPTTPFSVGMSLWEKILNILLSPIALIIYLILIITGIIMLVKRRRKHKKIMAEKNVEKSS